MTKLFQKLVQKLWQKNCLLLNQPVSRLHSNSKISPLLEVLHLCLLWAAEFPRASSLRSNTSFVLVGVVAQHPPGESLPRSMAATCWRISPWRLRHRHTSLGFFFRLCCLSPRPTTLHSCFWIQKLTDRIEFQSIFLLLWRSKRALFMCISSGLQSSSCALITAPCNSHHCSFVGMNVALLHYYGFMLVCTLLFTKKTNDLFFLILVCMFTCFFRVQYEFCNACVCSEIKNQTHFTVSMYFQESCC